MFIQFYDYQNFNPKQIYNDFAYYFTKILDMWPYDIINKRLWDVGVLVHLDHHPSKDVVSQYLRWQEEWKHKYFLSKLAQTGMYTSVGEYEAALAHVSDLTMKQVIEDQIQPDL